MSTQLEVATDLGSTDRISVTVDSSTAVRLADRIALRVGLALILWGQRPRRGRTVEEALLAREAALQAQAERDGHRRLAPPQTPFG